MRASHRREAGTRHWRQQRKLQQHNMRCSTKKHNKRGVRTDTGTRVSCLQIKVKGYRQVRRQGEGTALPSGGSMTLRNKGMRYPNQRLNQINKTPFPLRACGPATEVAVWTNAVQHQELCFLCIPSLSSKADTVFFSKRPVFTINYLTVITETSLSFCALQSTRKKLCPLSHITP